MLEKANLDDFKNIRHNFSMYLFVIIMGWLVGGIYEELVFHGFIFKGIEKIITGRTGFIISFVLTNLIFGLYHVQLGASGIINAFAAGCAYHALAIKFQRNLWFAVFFHGFFDTIALSYIYLGYW
ncbi:MAG: family intrarane metalloprotease [Chitinophagaceae bacterium]|nr:family intrarane metalloprotease [Chitinophagaceae bacterium]